MPVIQVTCRFMFFKSRGSRVGEEEQSSIYYNNSVILKEITITCTGISLCEGCSPNYERLYIFEFREALDHVSLQTCTIPVTSN